MIIPYKTLFLHPTLSSNVIYLDFMNKVQTHPSRLNNSHIRKLTHEEYLNIRELEKINLHIPYILSLLKQE